MANSSIPPPGVAASMYRDDTIDLHSRVTFGTLGLPDSGRRRRRAVAGKRMSNAGTDRQPPSVRTLTAVPGRRSVVDYSLQRRAVLADVYAGRTGLFEVCDASPYLSRAAKYHGEATDVACPVCRKERLHQGELRVRRPSRSDVRPGEDARSNWSGWTRCRRQFTVYEVEVCRSCGWNHLDASYVMGAEPVPGQQPRRQPAPGRPPSSRGGRLRPGRARRQPCRGAAGPPPLPQLKTPSPGCDRGRPAAEPRSQRGVPSCHPTTRPHRSRPAPDRSAVPPRRGPVPPVAVAAATEPAVRRQVAGHARRRPAAVPPARAAPADPVVPFRGRRGRARTSARREGPALQEAARATAG